MDINEKINLSAYNVNWANQFADEKKILQAHFPNTHIEHVGSTSIEGMIAKPIIDILIGVDYYPPLEEMIMILEGLGYYNFSEGTKLKDRLYLTKRGVIGYNVHITKYLAGFWNHIISFREHLKTHEEDVLKYSEIKQSIFNKGIDTMMEYSKEKGDFISDILKK